jgi:hypothetical protein
MVTRERLVVEYLERGVAEAVTSHDARADDHRHRPPG